MEEKDRFGRRVSAGAARYNTFLSYDEKKTNNEVMYGAGIIVIHVHHTKMLSIVGPDYRPDPRTDLLPVCPNCHAVIHSADPPHSIETVRLMLDSVDHL